MIERGPLKVIGSVLGAAALLLIAFGAPVESATSEPNAAGSADTVTETTATAAANAEVADGAALPGSRSGVTTPPEQRAFPPLPQPAPGTKPVQTIVVSVDGGCETADGTIRRFLDVGKQVNGRFTFFVSGLCLLPEDQHLLYEPPGREPGESDIGFATAELVQQRIRIFTDMWREGHEVGTHFLGHFCGAGGVDTWTAEQWQDEFRQARTFLDSWPANNAQVSEPLVLPFDSSVMKGGRTPCLEGNRPAMFQAFAADGFRYDASDPGTLQWPTKVGGGALWQFPLPALKLAGTDKWVLSMDYNFLVNQTDGETDVAPAKCAEVEQQMHDTYMAALDALYAGNRSPLFLGSHLNNWVCGAYINSLQRFIVDAKVKYPDVEFVTNLEIADWLDAMDPGTVKALQQLPAERY